MAAPRLAARFRPLIGGRRHGPSTSSVANTNPLLVAAAPRESMDGRSNGRRTAVESSRRLRYLIRIRSTIFINSGAARRRARTRRVAGNAALVTERHTSRRKLGSSHERQDRFETPPPAKHPRIVSRGERRWIHRPRCCAGLGAGTATATGRSRGHRLATGAQDLSAPSPTTVINEEAVQLSGDTTVER